MEKGDLEVQRFPHETFSDMSYKGRYAIPEDYNPADHPPVKMRSGTHSDLSETQRKRRSKNRLSNRRSTGYVNDAVVDEALRMGPDGENESEKSNK